MIYKIQVLLEEIEHLMTELLSECRELQRQSGLFLAHCKSGRLRVSKGRNAFQYYLIEDTDSAYHYLSRSKDEKLISRMVHKKYHQLVKRSVGKQIDELEAVQERLDIGMVDRMQQAVEKGLLPYIQDVHIDRRQFIADWILSAQRDSLNDDFRPEGKRHVTSFGLWVQSKSEVLIAETLYRQHIPFKYEGRQFIDGIGMMHPDFVCLNTRMCREVVWEHLGMIDDPEYAENAFLKLQRYEKQGFSFRSNLCITAETGNQPLTSELIERRIREYLL